MSKCAIVGEATIKKLIQRYDGIGKPLTNDEREILLFALYNESEMRGGMVTEVRKSYLKKRRAEGGGGGEGLASWLAASNSLSQLPLCAGGISALLSGG